MSLGPARVSGSASEPARQRLVILCAGDGAADAHEIRMSGTARRAAAASAKSGSNKNAEGCASVQMSTISGTLKRWLRLTVMKPATSPAPKPPTLRCNCAPAWQRVPVGECRGQIVRSRRDRCGARIRDGCSAVLRKRGRFAVERRIAPNDVADDHERCAPSTWLWRIFRSGYCSSPDVPGLTSGLARLSTNCLIRS